MAPELVAQLLRDAGHQVTIREAEKAIKLPSGLWYRSRTPIIDGQESTLADLCAAANALRTKAGLPELSVPAEGVAA